MPIEQKNISLPGPIIILKETFAIYKKRLGVFMGILFFPTLINTIVASVDKNQISTLFVFGIVSFLMGIWVQPALFFSIKDSQENIGVIESYRRGWHKIISYWWVAFLTGIIVFIGLLILIVPGIIFAFWFGFSVFIIVSEDLHGMAALRRSREYMKGKLGDVGWRFLFLFFVVLFFSIILEIILTILHVPFRDQVFSFIIGLFLSPLLTTYSFQLYLKLKELKENVIQIAPVSEGQTRN